MSIESTLYSTLSGDSGVSAIVSSRIYPSPAPESAVTPYITYQLVSGVRITTLPGTGDATRKRIQINCHANTYSEAKSLAAAVQAALEGDGYMEIELDLYDPAGQVHTVAVDWSFFAP